MRNIVHSKHPRRITPGEKEILKLVERSEPAALVLDNPTLRDAADILVIGRFLGKVEVRGEVAYRLTEFGRAALQPETVAA